MDEAEVETAILEHVLGSVSQASYRGEAFWGRITVGRYVVEYRAYHLGAGAINIGTYYVVP